MSEDFGLLNPVTSPFLERVVREERLGYDQQRKQGNGREKFAHKAVVSSPPDETEGAEVSMSSNHIDLRI